MKFSKYFFVIFFTIGSLFPSQLESDFESKEYKVGAKGLELYYEGEYKKAAKKLKKALDGGEYIFAETYADICYRNLDDGHHDKKESARWYLKAAEFGCGDSSSFLASINPDFLRKDIDFEISLHNLEATFLARDLTINTNKGWDYYIQGKYKDAAFYFKMASEGGHCIAQRFLADICFRQLDEEPHSLFEAAQWYLFAARGGDGDSYSYLNTRMPGLWQVAEPVEQIKAIVGFWIASEASNEYARGPVCGIYKAVKPADVNNYLVKKFRRKINKTTAQKLAYFFDKVSSAMIHQLAFAARHQKVNESSEESKEEDEDQGSSSSSSSSSKVLKKRRLNTRVSFCRPLEVSTSVSMNALAMAAGPVYETYRKSLSNGNIPTPRNLPRIPIYAEFLLTGLHEFTKDMNASQLITLSHREYPWILAGIAYWEDYHRKKFTAGDLYIEALKQKLIDGDVIDATFNIEVRQIVNFVEKLRKV